MNKKILLLSHFSEGGGNAENDRFRYMAEMLKEYDVTLITSSFFHTKKEHTQLQEENKKGYRTIYLRESGYKKNVCLKRFYSHYEFGKNLYKCLIENKLPADLIYCAVPSLSAGFAAIKAAKRKDIPVIVDIQDLWPEAFKMVFNPPVLGGLIYLPMKKRADYIYKNADGIVAVSETYCNRAKSAQGTRTKEYKSVYIGTSFKAFDMIAPVDIKKEKEAVYIIYVGTLGKSYDLHCAIEAVGKARERLGLKLKFIVIGDGPQEEEFKAFAVKKNIQVDFLGRLPYDKMAAWLKTADIALNPIKSKSAASIINKHADYAAAGLPVISTQESQEYNLLLKRYDAGYFGKCGDANFVAEKIVHLAENPEVRKRMSSNSRKMGEELFNRDHCYSRIKEMIEKFI